MPSARTMLGDRRSRLPLSPVHVARSLCDLRALQYLDLIHMIRQEAASQELKGRHVPSASELTQPLLPK